METSLFQGGGNHADEMVRMRVELTLAAVFDWPNGSF